MGGPNAPGTGTSATPPPTQPGTQLSDLWSVLNAIWQLLLSVFGGGFSNPQVLKVKVTTHLIFVPISSGPLRVKKAIIQNPLSTDVLLLDTNNAQGLAVSIPTDGTSGFLLNPAGVSGQGGGSHPFGNIDLSQIFITVTVSDGKTIPVYYEQ